MSITNLFLAVGVAVLAVIVVAIVVFVAGAVLTAWSYAKSPRGQIAEEL